MNLHRQHLVKFIARHWLGTLAPFNSFWTNRQALRAAARDGGVISARGALHLLQGAASEVEHVGNAAFRPRVSQRRRRSRHDSLQ